MKEDFVFLECWLIQEKGQSGSFVCHSNAKFARNEKIYQFLLMEMHRNEKRKS